MTSEAVLEGRGLHGGAWARLRFVRETGPVTLRAGGHSAMLDELVLDGSSRSSCATTRDARLRIGTVEHLFAALAGLGIREGIAIEIDGTEVPLVDGGARAFVDILATFGLAVMPPKLVVARAGRIEIGRSIYELAIGTDVRLAIEIDFDDARLDSLASWSGDPLDFRDRVAPARTFGFAHEVEELAARGLASHVARESVVVIANDRIMSAGPRFRSDEPARHKLLDLIGDFYAYGGPPRGCVRATRPGHAATHDAIRRALAEGLLVSDRTR